MNKQTIYKIIIACAALLSTNVFASAKGNHHFPAIFIGSSTIDDKSDFTYGLEYEYKYDRTWGAGITIEKTDDAYEGAGVDVAVISAYFHPLHHARIGLGIGKEKVNGINGHDNHTNKLFRLSANYDFVVGNFEISPTVAFDFIDGEVTTVLGLAFIRPF